jgi:hypothetical protein
MDEIKKISYVSVAGSHSKYHLSLEYDGKIYVGNISYKEFGSNFINLKDLGLLLQNKLKTSNSVTYKVDCVIPTQSLYIDPYIENRWMCDPGTYDLLSIGIFITKQKNKFVKKITEPICISLWLDKHHPQNQKEKLDYALDFLDSKTCRIQIKKNEKTYSSLVNANDLPYKRVCKFQDFDKYLNCIEFTSFNGRTYNTDIDVTDLDQKRKIELKITFFESRNGEKIIKLNPTEKTLKIVLESQKSSGDSDTELESTNSIQESESDIEIDFSVKYLDSQTCELDFELLNVKKKYTGILDSQNFKSKYIKISDLQKVFNYEKLPDSIQTEYFPQEISLTNQLKITIEVKVNRKICEELTILLDQKAQENSTTLLDQKAQENSTTLLNQNVKEIEPIIISENKSKESERPNKRKLCQEDKEITKCAEKKCKCPDST